MGSKVPPPICRAPKLLPSSRGSSGQTDSTAQRHGLLTLRGLGIARGIRRIDNPRRPHPAASATSMASTATSSPASSSSSYSRSPRRPQSQRRAGKCGPRRPHDNRPSRARRQHPIAKLMLQVNDGFFVFPVGLNDHALDGTTDHARKAPGSSWTMRKRFSAAGDGAPIHRRAGRPAHRRPPTRRGAWPPAHPSASINVLRPAPVTADTAKNICPSSSAARVEVGNLIGRARRIALVGDNDLRTLRKLGAILLELAVDDVVILDRIAILKTTRHVDDVHDQGRTLNVAQELVTRAPTTRSRLR